MALDESTWDDTGFDPENDNDGGFLSSGQQPRKRVAAEAPPPPPPTPPAKKKGSGALFWFGAVALGVLLVSIIGGGAYYFTRPSVEEQAFVVPTEVLGSDNANTADAAPAKTTSAGTDESENTAAGQSVQHDEEALDLLFGEEAPAAKNSESIASAKPVVKPTPSPTLSPSPEPMPVAKPTPKPAISKSSATMKTTSAPKGGALFVIQVYSSPSRDDADERLQLLRMKNVSDGYITEQQIKGEPWYRVRFGQFTTRQAAEAEAIRLGLQQPWIARIR